MSGNKSLSVLILCSIILTAACNKEPDNVVVLKKYPITSLDGVISRTGIDFDSQITSDGNGAVRITAGKPATIHLFETGDVDVDNARLTYKAKIRTDDIKGRVFLAMWCQFDDKGEYFSRALHSSVSGTTGWTSRQTDFFLRAGENPDNVKLDLVVDGTGTVWVDDVELLKTPLP